MMRLKAGDKAPRLRMTDVEGTPIVLGAHRRRMLLSFFGDATCPFCNVRVHELNEHYRELSSRGLEVVVVYRASQAALWRFVSGHPRPFPVIADPRSVTLRAYGIERSLVGKLKAIVTRWPAWLAGMRLVGWSGLGTDRIMPADFLIDEHGVIVAAYYGRDTGDYLPMARVEAYANTTASPASTPRNAK